MMTGSLFWRRLVALIIDMIILTFLVFLIVYMLNFTGIARFGYANGNGFISQNGSTFIISTSNKETYPVPSNLPLKERMDDYNISIPDYPVTISSRDAIIERRSWFLGKNTDYVRPYAFAEQLGVKPAKRLEVTVPLNDRWQYEPRIDIGDFLLSFAWILGVPLLWIFGHETFGRYVMGLRVISVPNKANIYKRIGREALKFYMLIFTFLPAVPFWFIGNDLDKFWEVSVAQIKWQLSGAYNVVYVLSVISFVIWLVALVQACMGKRQVIWDKLTGHIVLETGEQI